MKKRKITSWIAGLLALPVLLVLIVLLAGRHRANKRYARFALEHAEAPRRAEAIVRTLATALRPKPAPPLTSATQPALIAAEPLAFPALGEDKLDSIWREFIDLNFVNFMYYFGDLHWRRTVLPAAEFVLPPAAANAPLRLTTAFSGWVQRKVHEEALWFALHTEAGEDVPTTVIQTLGLRAAHLIDRTAALLLSDWTDPSQMVQATSCRVWWGNMPRDLVPLAIMRAFLAGRHAKAGRLLEQYVRLLLVLRPREFPGAIALYHVQSLILDLAGQGVLDDATLKRLDGLLIRARLDKAQLADLRAAAILKYNLEIERQSRHEQISRLQRLNLFRTVKKEFIKSQMREVQMAWACNDTAAYDRALSQPLSHHLVLEKARDGFCPAEMGAFNQETSVNDQLDLTRLTIAVARHRLAHGRYPESIDELMPAYLDPGFLENTESTWGVSIFRPSTKDYTGERPVFYFMGERPIFYHARRTTWNYIRWMANNYVHDECRIEENQGWLARTLGDRVPWLKFVSDTRVEGLMVEVVWPFGSPWPAPWFDWLKALPPPAPEAD